MPPKYAGPGRVSSPNPAADLLVGVTRGRAISPDRGESWSKIAPFSSHTSATIGVGAVALLDTLTKRKRGREKEGRPLAGRPCTDNDSGLSIHDVHRDFKTEPNLFEGRFAPHCFFLLRVSRMIVGALIDSALSRVLLTQVFHREQVVGCD